jgi:acyl-CoA synthetase (AMP-forming)/AMP-acid ligase II
MAIKHKCTGFSFVGEICRYLLNQPPSELDRQHSIRACVGNGMRGVDIHRQFTERFGIKCVEIYGATEGNAILINIEGKYGACGFLPLINDYITLIPTYIIKVDQDNQPVRDADGHCVRCGVNEKGLLVGVIGNNTKEDFSGYANQKEQNEKKIVQNLFKPNQRAFNTGDLLVKDWLGYTYFVDRLGDTFRWRGENVSTFEVENIISSRLNSKEVIVYGVEVPGQEGKAGMATILDLNVDIAALGEHIKKDLAPYAKPLFIRLEAEVEHTGYENLISI